MAIRPSRRRPVRFRAGVKRITQSFRARQHPTTVAITEDLRSQFKGIEKQLAKVINTLIDATPDALEHALTDIAIDARELTPIDKGPLRESIYLVSRRTAAGAIAEVGFGATGPSVEYAVLVHENLEWHHKPPTQAKFLEKAINDNLAEVLPALHDFMRLT